jgi:hypothetical protein
MLFNRSVIANTGVIPNGSGGLITDVCPLEIVDTKKTISESVKGGTPAIRVTGIFQRCDQINANGRVYPSGVLSNAIDSIREDIQKRRVLGEFDHPSDAKIHLDRVSHVLTKLWMEGKIVYGELEVLEDMPCGGMLKTLLEHTTIGISSRGVGDMQTTMLEGEEIYEVQPGYKFVTFDAVAEPSVPGSYLAVMESKQRMMKRNLRAEREARLIEEIRKQLR